MLPPFDTRWEAYWPMFRHVAELLEEYKPNKVIVEKTSSFIGGFVSGQVSQCMGAIFVACGKYNVDVDFAFPTSVKKTVAGHGKATKTQIKKAVVALISNNGISLGNGLQEHAYDAMANILFHLIKNGELKPLEEFPWLSEKQLKTRKKVKNGKK